jgi:hypothetical protein
MSRDRPEGWLDAAGVCLDLSLAELAFVCASAQRTWREANRCGNVVFTNAGRVELAALPRGATVASVRDEVVAKGDHDATFRIYVRGSKARKGEVAWAEQLRPVEFELSDFEQAALAAMTGR